MFLLKVSVGIVNLCLAKSNLIILCRYTLIYIPISYIIYIYLHVVFVCSILKFMEIHFFDSHSLFFKFTYKNFLCPGIRTRKEEIYLNIYSIFVIFKV